MQNRLRAAAFAVLLAAGFGCHGGHGHDGHAEHDEHAERMAAAHEGDAPVASPAAAAEPAAAVATETVAYGEVDGAPVNGFLARPEGVEGAPGVIVIHEWWGLNENIESMARQLAGEGYLALAVDLYGGQAASDRDGARALMSAAMEEPAALEENLRQAYAYLKAHGAAKVGSIGWCFGGGWSLETALLLPGDLDAAVVYYGRVVTDRERLAVLTAPILGHFGSEDQGIPIDGVREFEQALAELGKDARIHVYDGADHAFANPSGIRYDAEAAEAAWERTLAFFDGKLRG